MSYWVLALLAASAGALFGAARPHWPWRGERPVRATISIALTLFVLLAIIAGHFLRWDERFGRFTFIASAGVVATVAVWLVPARPSWTRWVMTLFFAWLAWKAYGLFGAP